MGRLVADGRVLPEALALLHRMHGVCGGQRGGVEIALGAGRQGALGTQLRSHQVEVATCADGQVAAGRQRLCIQGLRRLERADPCGVLQRPRHPRRRFVHVGPHRQVAPGVCGQVPGRLHLGLAYAQVVVGVQDHGVAGGQGAPSSHIQVAGCGQDHVVARLDVSRSHGEVLAGNKRKVPGRADGGAFQCDVTGGLDAGRAGSIDASAGTLHIIAASSDIHRFCRQLAAVEHVAGRLHLHGRATDPAVVDQGVGSEPRLLAALQGAVVAHGAFGVHLQVPATGDEAAGGGHARPGVAGQVDHRDQDALALRLLFHQPHDVAVLRAHLARGQRGTQRQPTPGRLLGGLVHQCVVPGQAVVGPGLAGLAAARGQALHHLPGLARFQVEIAQVLVRVAGKTQPRGQCVGSGWTKDEIRRSTEREICAIGDLHVVLAVDHRQHRRSQRARCAGGLRLRGASDDNRIHVAHCMRATTGVDPRGHQGIQSVAPHGRGGAIAWAGDGSDRDRGRACVAAAALSWQLARAQQDDLSWFLLNARCVDRIRPAGSHHHRVGDIARAANADAAPGDDRGKAFLRRIGQLHLRRTVVAGISGPLVCVVGRAVVQGSGALAEADAIGCVEFPLLQRGE